MQEESIEYVASTIQRMLEEDAAAAAAAAEQPQQQQQGQEEGREGRQAASRGGGPFRRLYCIAAYNVGKERIFSGERGRGRRAGTGW